MNTCFLLIGGNLGDREQYLSQATELIMINIGRIIDFSSIYETAAWGMEDQPSFLNQVLKVQTKLTATELLQATQAIEEKLHRVRTEKYAARTIDLDILLFNNDIYNSTDLVIPHPRMNERRFVLVPLAEIAPTYLHPVHLKTVKLLLSICTDPLPVEKYIPKF